MPRSIWKGSITFGLVSIPVSLQPAEQRNELSFKLLDRRDLAPVRYQRVNERTGKEVPWDDVVKGYEYEKGEFVVLTDEDFKRANVEASQTVEIVSFVDGSEISPIYYDKPYYLEPQKKAHKSYALLREVLRRSGKVGIAKLVIRSKQYIAAVLVEGPVLVVNLLRYAYEIRNPKELDLPAENPKALDISPKELDLAERLVEAMVDKWDPEKFRDTYRDDLMALIEKKIKTGAAKRVEPVEVEQPRRRAQVVDIMSLLKRSVEQVGREAPHSRKRERRRKAG